VTAQATHLDAGAPWSGVAPAKTLLDLFVPAARTAPHRPAMQLEEGLVVTAGELVARAGRLAGWLRDRVAPGDGVALMLDNRVEYMVVQLAVVAVRGIVVSINPTAQEHDAGHILRDSGAKLAIVGEEQSALVEALRERCPALGEVAVVRGQEPGGLAAYASEAGDVDLATAACEPHDITHVYYTSGTTGAAKGCMVDHVWWLRCVDVELRLNPKDERDRMLSCLPFYYADPAVMLAACVHSGATLVVMRRFSVSRFWDVVGRFGVTDMWTISSMPALLLKGVPTPGDRNHKVTRAIAVGVDATIHREIVGRFGFPFIDNYGSTEATINIRVPRHLADELVGSGSIGAAVPECEIRLLDANGEEVPVGEVGEIVVRTPGMFRGYLNRPDATAEVLSGDGWYSTGDLASRDERGLYYFAGRKKDMIRRGGENVAAAEIEEVLRAHPQIVEAAVIPVPDSLWGEEIKAYVLPADGLTMEDLPPQAIIEHCRTRLAKFKVPRYLEYRDTDFPRTPSMRVKKETLKNGDLTANAWDREAEHAER